MLAYLSRRGSENFGQESRAIVVRTLDSGEERELLPKLAHIERARWSPDGKTLLVSGSDSKGRGGIYLVDARTGAARELAAEAGAPFRGYDAAWSPDGRWLYYIRGDELRRREAGGEGESTLYRAGGLGALAVSPDGKLLAAGLGGKAIVLLQAAGGEARMLPFEGLGELEWGQELIAGKDAELWRIALDGAAPVKISAPGNRAAGFSLHPDGKRIAMTAGNARSEVWALAVR
jgi:Tol biopolymer transport system component